MEMQPLERFHGYPVLRRPVQVGSMAFEIVGPANYEALIDDPRVVARFEQDEYLPYWAEFWPASLLLADAVAEWEPADPSNPISVLELGCGLGVASLVALRLGYRVIASDYDADALEFVKESARRSGLPAPETRLVDWRQTYPDLKVQRIVAAEVLYEARHIEPIAEFVRRHLDRDGFALLCDANRTTADAFEGVARRCGLSVEVCPAERPRTIGQALRGRIFRLTACEKA